jgi:CRISPR-associated protein Cmr2
MDSPTPLSEGCRQLVAKLTDAERPPRTPPPHAAENGAALHDHLLTSAALVACLAHNEPQCDLLRLAALTHDLPSEEYGAELADLEKIIPGWVEAIRPWVEEIQRWRELLQQHGAALDRGEQLAFSSLDSASRTLALAHLAAAKRTNIAQATGFAAHPLATGGSVDLVYGGAIKIKSYVFESVKLPEIRGASALLDHINRVDLPAFWGVAPQLSQDTSLQEAQRRRYNLTRAWLQQQIGIAALDAPECLLYASGGNLLALAPAGHGAALAKAIEQRYTSETQVAQSVAVWGNFSLLELQYGLRPSAFWLDRVEAQQLFSSSDPAAQLFRQTFGIKQIADDSPGDLEAARTIFCQRKGFGELVTLLTAKAARRRMSDGAVEGEARPLPFMEYVGTTRRCSSCDVRPASKPLDGPRPERRETFCEPCSCKRDVGTQAKKGEPQRGEQRNPAYDWIRPWGTWLQEQQPGTVVKQSSHDLHDISKYSRGFVGLIYADGNSVGEQVARLASISGYRRFAQRMLQANETAVAQALARFIRPDTGLWPFEIITIGGDDVLLFVPADRALDIAAAIARAFEEKMHTPGTGRQISLSVGVLIMPDNTPIRFASNLVEQLLNSAKQRSKRENIGSTVDFMALKSTTMISNRVEQYRSIALQRGRRQHSSETPRSTLRLTQRPYSLAQLQQFLKACRALKRAQFPRSQLYQLREITEQGDILRAAVDYRYFVERGKQRNRNDHDRYKIFDEQIQALCVDQSGGRSWMPCRRENPSAGDTTIHHYDTPLLDLIELFPFVAAAEEQGDPA